MTQTPSPFTPHFGFSIPAQIEKAGLQDSYIEAMKKAGDAYSKLSSVSESAASYVLPNAYNRRVLLQSNFRSLYHFLALRTSPTAHFSMRRIAHQMADQVIEAIPSLGKYIRVNESETTEEIETNFFYQV